MQEFIDALSSRYVNESLEVEGERIIEYSRFAQQTSDPKGQRFALQIGRTEHYVQHLVMEGFDAAKC